MRKSEEAENDNLVSSRKKTSLGVFVEQKGALT